jgi:hypothetical protein
MTVIIDFDAIIAPVLPSIKVDGKTHKMGEPTVETFLRNMKLIEKLGDNPSPVEEMEAGIEMILSAFPTLTRAQMNKWTLARIQALVDLARSSAGETVTENADEAASGNDQPAT